MELTAKEKNAIYWGGAIKGAIAGIPQGLLLGALGFGLLAGGIYLFGATSLVSTFGTFLFGSVGAATEAIAAGNIGAFIGALNPLTFVALNTVLTLVGNFLTGGNQAVAEAKQAKQNAYLDAKMMQIEGRERQVEQLVTQHLVREHEPAQTPRHVQKILEEGPRVKVEKPSDSHAADVVTDRLESAERTIH